MVDFHANSNIKKLDNQYYNLELDINEARMLSDVLKNVVNHLGGKINLAKKGLLKDSCYHDEGDRVTF